jgi:hypothetical protein
MDLAEFHRRIEARGETVALMQLEDELLRENDPSSAS